MHIHVIAPAKKWTLICEIKIIVQAIATEICIDYLKKALAIQNILFVDYVIDR